MTAQLLFNQFAYTDRLARAGFTPDQARASAEALETALSEAVATKSDVDRAETALKADINGVETALKADINGVETRLILEIANVRAEIAQVELKIAQAKNDILKWFFTFNLALVGAIFAIVKFVH